MPRRPANVNQADCQRLMRAFKREGIPFRATLQPGGAAVFEPAINTALSLKDDLDRELVEFEARHGQG